ncbi:photosynthetic reaction center subunit H [Aquibium sp. A9E412]|uniref:photosynthetic reaction center subunit H n=1 Tax=Aquibium sp. A9E412 TaxID=2976767 RepID=UPI0025B011A0|nr:photosynthetic reaction center subunit H [Aquibium sp. A9E412]MDN2566059.1 photosynthetic reaction center subunit H [Aquibium sp. A9E412]
METGSIVGNIDVAQVTLYAFWVFFAGLIWYLRQEDRREGYPLEDDVTGRYNKHGFLFVPPAKTFVIGHGHPDVRVPDGSRDTRAISTTRTAAFSGAASVPTGDPMLAGVGPGSWAERADRPDVTARGAPRIVPMRVAPEVTVASEDPDPRGMRVVGCDSVLAGTVRDIWVDMEEHLIRYLEVALTDGGEEARSVLLPINFSVFRSARGAERVVYVHAITAAQFANVPGLAAPDQVTRLEEERVVAYYGGGQLYATPKRQEALL